MRNSTGPPTVLVVETDFGIRDRLAALVEKCGSTVIACPGPSAPEFKCVGTQRDCPLVQAADTIVLDLTFDGDEPRPGGSASKLLSYYMATGKSVVVVSRIGIGVRRVVDEQVTVLNWPRDSHHLRKLLSQSVSA